MVKSTQKVIDAYEKQMMVEEDTRMDFKEELNKKINNIEHGSRKNVPGGGRKTTNTPILHKNYWDNIDRYRRIAHVTNITDMNIFKK